VWCAAKNPIANDPVNEGGMTELDRRLRTYFFGDADGQGQTVTENVLLSSRRQTLEYEARYRAYKLDAAGEYQEDEDYEPTALDYEPWAEDGDLHDLVRSTAEDSDEEE